MASPTRSVDCCVGLVVVADIGKFRIVLDRAGAGFRLDEIGAAEAEPAGIEEREVGDRLLLLLRGADAMFPYEETRAAPRYPSRPTWTSSILLVQAGPEPQLPVSCIFAHRIAEDAPRRKPAGQKSGMSVRGMAQPCIRIVIVLGADQLAESALVVAFEALHRRATAW